MKKSWNGCQKYMLRCVARRALFHSAMNTPSQVNLEANCDIVYWYPFYVLDAKISAATFSFTFSGTWYTNLERL